MSDDQLGGVFPNLPEHRMYIKAEATFWVSDVQDAFDVTKGEAAAWLSKHRETIEQHMLDVGNEVIRDLGMEDGLTPREKHED